MKSCSSRAGIITWRKIASCFSNVDCLNYCWLRVNWDKVVREFNVPQVRKSNQRRTSFLDKNRRVFCRKVGILGRPLDFRNLVNFSIKIIASKFFVSFKSPSTSRFKINLISNLKFLRRKSHSWYIDWIHIFFIDFHFQFQE